MWFSIWNNEINTINQNHLDLKHKFITKNIQINTLDKQFTDLKEIQIESLSIQSEIDKLILENPNLWSFNEQFKRLVIKKEQNDKEMKEILNKIDETLDESKQNSIFDGFSEILNKFLEQYKQFVETLSPDQIVALINIFGYFMILYSIFTIISILFGEYLISKYNLSRLSDKSFFLIVTFICLYYLSLVVSI